MSRMRMMKPEFCVSEQLAECSPNARLVFALMWMFCDDQGIHPAKPRALKGEIFPLDEGITAKHVEQWIGELIAVGLLREYEVGSERYWLVTGWTKHQRIEKPTKKYPLPLTEDSPRTPRKLVEPSATEGKGREGVGEEAKQPPPPRLPEVETAPPNPPPVAVFSVKAPAERVAMLASIAIQGGVRNANSNNPHVQQWAADGVTDDTLRDAIAEVRRTGKPVPQAIAIAYLQPVVARIHEGSEAQVTKRFLEATEESHVAH